MSDPIRVSDLRFAYPPLSPDSPQPWVIDGLNLCVAEGEWLAVMGASDAGKTTLCLLLAGLAPHLTGGLMDGKILIEGRDTRETPPPALASTVGILLQEPESQLFNTTVEAEIAWGLENLGLPRAEIRARVDQALTLLRLEHLCYRSPGEISGGEKKRLALASVLAMRPRLLLLDEPMGGLDPVGRSEVLATLSELRRDRSTTIVMTESDPEAVAAFADRLAVLHEGRIALEGPPRLLFGQVDGLTSQGVAAPQMARLAAVLNRRLGTTFSFLTQEEALAALLPALVRQARSGAGLAPLNHATSAGEGSAGHSPEASPLKQARTGTCLKIADLWFWYAEERAPALRAVDLGVAAGELVALVGANGSGKTTLIKHFNGLLRPGRGQVQVFGQDTAGRSIGELARQVGYLFQHPEQQIFSATVHQEIAFGPLNLGLAQAEVEDRTRSALARFGLSTVAGHPPAILSYGLRRRVTLASLAAMDPPLVVLDEPTVGLDAHARQDTVEWLRQLRIQGHTVVLVTHDMALAAEQAERVVILHRGQVVAHGSPQDLFQQPDLLAMASLVPPPLVALAHELRPYGFRDDCLTLEAFCDAYSELLGDRK